MALWREVPPRPQEQLAPFCTAAETPWIPKVKVCSKGRAPQGSKSSAYVNPSFRGTGQVGREAHYGREALVWEAALGKGVGSAFHTSKLLDAEGRPKSNEPLVKTRGQSCVSDSMAH